MLARLIVVNSLTHSLSLIVQPVHHRRQFLECLRLGPAAALQPHRGDSRTVASAGFETRPSDNGADDGNMNERTFHLVAYAIRVAPSVPCYLCHLAYASRRHYSLGKGETVRYSNYNKCILKVFPTVLLIEGLLCGYVPAKG